MRGLERRVSNIRHSLVYVFWYVQTPCTSASGLGSKLANDVESNPPSYQNLGEILVGSGTVPTDHAALSEVDGTALTVPSICESGEPCRVS